MAHFLWLKCGCKEGHYQAKSEWAKGTFFRVIYLWILSLSAKDTLGSYQSITSQQCQSDPIACTLKLRWQLLLSKVRFKNAQGENNHNRNTAGVGGRRRKKRKLFLSFLCSVPCFFHTCSHHKQQIITFTAFSKNIPLIAKGIENILSTLQKELIKEVKEYQWYTET